MTRSQIGTFIVLPFLILTTIVIGRFVAGPVPTVVYKPCKCCCCDHCQCEGECCPPGGIEQTTKPPALAVPKPMEK